VYMKSNPGQPSGVFILWLVFFAFVARTEEPFSIAVVPDTQTLVRYGPQYWRQQCQWIVDNQSARNIKAVLHVGDLVETAEQSQDWSNALSGLEILKEANIPFILAPGNHDMDGHGFPQKMTNLTQNLPQSWFTANTNWNGGFYDAETLNGSYLLVSNETSAYLIVALAYVPDEETVNWARAITQQYSNCPAIFVTHCFVDDSPWGRRASWTQAFSIERFYGDLGRWWSPNRMWTDWLRHSQNIFWVISGHLSGDLNSMYFSERAEDGHLITQSLCDYQDTTRGFMQLLTVAPAENVCRIETFSTRTGEVLTNWNEKYAFPLSSTNQDYFSKWQLAQAAVTNGLILWNGFDRTNESGFVGLSPYGTTLTGAVAVASGGIYINCYPAFSNMVQSAEFDVLTGLTNITVSLWFKATNATPASVGVLAGKFRSGIAGEWYLAAIGPSGLRWTLVNTNHARINLDVATPGPITDGYWHHMVSSYDGTNARIYLDGNPIGSMPFSGRLKGTSIPVSIGGLAGQGSTTQSVLTPWGWMDRVRIWNRALSQREINNTYAKDLATLNSMRVESVPGELSGGVEVDTSVSSQYVLRFAVAANPSIVAEQRMMVSWAGSMVADVSLIQGESSDKTNWVYTSVFVTSTNPSTRIEPMSMIGGSLSNAVFPFTNGPVIADITVTPFFPPSLRCVNNETENRFEVDLPAHLGIAYRLEMSSDLELWNPASRWIVAGDNRIRITLDAQQSARQFFRVQVGL
jgi:hypothetical protein